MNFRRRHNECEYQFSDFLFYADCRGFRHAREWTRTSMVKNEVKKWVLSKCPAKRLFMGMAAWITVPFCPM